MQPKQVVFDDEGFEKVSEAGILPYHLRPDVRNRTIDSLSININAVSGKTLSGCRGIKVHQGASDPLTGWSSAAEVLSCELTCSVQ